MKCITLYLLWVDHWVEHSFEEFWILWSNVWPTKEFSPQRHLSSLQRLSRTAMLGFKDTSKWLFLSFRKSLSFGTSNNKRTYMVFVPLRIFFGRFLYSTFENPYISLFFSPSCRSGIFNSFSYFFVDLWMCWHFLLLELFFIYIKIYFIVFHVSLSWIPWIPLLLHDSTQDLVIFCFDFGIILAFCTKDSNSPHFSLEHRLMGFTS